MLRGLHYECYGNSHTGILLCVVNPERFVTACVLTTTNIYLIHAQVVQLRRECIALALLAQCSAEPICAVRDTLLVVF